MKFIFPLIIFLSLNAVAVNNYESSAIGCRGVSQSFQLKVQSSVSVLNSFLETLSAQAEKDVLRQHIEQQLKYLIGISKEYRSIHVSKLAVSAFRDDINYLKTSLNTLQLPELESFWGPNISLGSDPYVKELVSHSGQSVLVKKIDYQTNVIVTICAPLPLSTGTLYSQLENLFYPLDPYLGFWINGKNERKIITAKNLKSGLVPICLSQDFLIFGTAPEYAWFYWQPVHRDGARLCRIEDKTWVTSFKIEKLENIPLKKETTLFSSNASDEIKIAAVFGQVSDSSNKRIKAYDNLYNDIQAIFDRCQRGQERMACYSELEYYFRKNQFDLDPGQKSLIDVLKFYAAMVSNHKLTSKKINESYLQFNLTGLSNFDQKMVSFSVYAGPTGVFNSYLASADYWNFVLTSFYQDDVFLYFGHAGVGQNLALRTVLERSTVKASSFKKRTKDLNLGIFNCEAYSYFGWDLNLLFENNSKTKNFVNLVASSGTEVSASFVSAYIENILKAKDVKVESLIENLAGYVLTDDVLMFQKIQVD